MAFLTDKTLFIHVQKTGGMTVREVLYRCRPTGRESGDSEGERHFGLPELRAAHPGIEAGRISFGFVRHPVTWLKSRWAFAVQTGLVAHTRHGKVAAATWMSCCWSSDFNVFIDKYLERYPGVVTQTMFQKLGLWSDKPADRIGKTENLLFDLTDILRQAGEVVDLSGAVKKNETDSTIRDSAAVSSSQQSRIMAAETLLCDRFGY